MVDSKLVAEQFRMEYSKATGINMGLLGRVPWGPKACLGTLLRITPACVPSRYVQAYRQGLKEGRKMRKELNELVQETNDVDTSFGADL